jgi:hypothetical protein
VDSGIFNIVGEGGRGVCIGYGVAADVLAVDSGWIVGAGVGKWLGSAGVPITFKTSSASGSPVCGLELEEEDRVD